MRNRSDRFQPQRFPGSGGEAAADDQVDSTTGANLVQQYLGLEFEFADHVAGLGQDLAVIGADLDDIAHAQIVDGASKTRAPASSMVL